MSLGIPQRTFSFEEHDEQSHRPDQRYQSQEYTQYSDNPRHVSPVANSPSPHQPFHSSSPPPPPTHRAFHHPGAHPNSSFGQYHSERSYGAPVGTAYSSPEPRSISDTTPGADNLSDGAPGGGIAELPREEPPYASFAPSPPRNVQRRPIPATMPTDDTYGSSSNVPLAAAALPPAMISGSANTSNRSLPIGQSPFRHEDNYSFSDNGYLPNVTYSQRDPPAGFGSIDPMDIEDDGDDGITRANPKRKSLLSLARPQSREASQSSAVGAAGGVAAATGFFGRKGSGNSNGQYDAVPNSTTNLGIDHEPEKSEWLSKQNSGSKRLRWIVGTIIVIIIVGAIVGGVIGGVLGSRNKGDDSGPSTNYGESAEEDDGRGDLGLNSAEIKRLMNNRDLHKVFPGMDYTPINTQYPECLHFPPSQNNVTRDMAVLSQLTNRVRLYGTDCNQTEMVLHAIERLELTDMKVWLGVWLGDNDTTNDRQVEHMWTILDDRGEDPFAGIVIGNEVLFREDLTATQLGRVLSDTKKQLARKNIDLPLATSDLGDNWRNEPFLVDDVDVVMANIHPFFAGVTAEEAAGWTWDFWNNNDIPLTQGTSKKNMISEVGWPSDGGNSCGARDCTTRTEGSVAGIEEMNTFMENWVCQSMDNETMYFWFEAFDEPWKIRFNEEDEGKEWEDKWGLMDVNRKLKPGIKIPDCGGRTPSYV
ncbi:glycoside hydrolase family 17 protein [Patellaria atrata CBS 101060]|uniref:glucan endo-1,3-beta-D-glucosidase n=1 Tax=Patellaria atrata CBS 101060 TaxID=1346257 RepID=A0A9P4VX40_9PEZI|nr:glycoside hydrolase family 17 protein [Patellaria atrata CBS 101060]